MWGQPGQAEPERPAGWGAGVELDETLAPGPRPPQLRNPTSPRVAVLSTNTISTRPVWHFTLEGSSLFSILSCPSSGVSIIKMRRVAIHLVDWHPNNPLTLPSPKGRGNISRHHAALAAFIQVHTSPNPPMPPSSDTANVCAPFSPRGRRVGDEGSKMKLPITSRQ